MKAEHGMAGHHHVTLVTLGHTFFLTLEASRSKKDFWVDPAEDPA